METDNQLKNELEQRVKDLFNNVGKVNYVYQVCGESVAEEDVLFITTGKYPEYLSCKVAYNNLQTEIHQLIKERLAEALLSTDSYIRRYAELLEKTQTK